MQRPTVRLLLILPGRAGKERSPVVGRPAAAVVLPEKIVFPVGGAGLQGLSVPDVFIGGVVYYQIHNQPHPPAMYLVKQLHEILHGSKLFHDFVIIPDVITVVIIGRIVDGRQPQGVHSQFPQVVQLADYALQIPDPVPIAVAETAGIDLVKDRLFPPLGRNSALCGAGLVLFAVHQFQQRVKKSCPQLLPRQFRHGAQLQAGHGPVGKRAFRQPQLQQYPGQGVMPHRTAVQLSQRAVIIQLPCCFSHIFPHFCAAFGA